MYAVLRLFSASLIRQTIVVGVLALFPMSIWAACSPYFGAVVFNEVQIPNGDITYLELRVLDPNVVLATSNFTNWSIEVYQNTSGNLVNSSSLVDLFRTPGQTPSGTNTCGQSSPWIQIPNSSIGNTIVRGVIAFRRSHGRDRKVIDYQNVEFGQLGESARKTPIAMGHMQLIKESPSAHVQH